MATSTDRLFWSYVCWVREPSKPHHKLFEGEAICVPFPGIQLRHNFWYRDAQSWLVTAPALWPTAAFTCHLVVILWVGRALSLAWESGYLRKLSPKRTVSWLVPPTCFQSYSNNQVVSFHCRKPRKHRGLMALLKVQFFNSSLPISIPSIHSFNHSFGEYLS